MCYALALEVIRRCESDLRAPRPMWPVRRTGDVRDAISTLVAWPDKARVLGQWHDSGTAVGALIRGNEDLDGLEDEGA